MVRTLNLAAAATTDPDAQSTVADFVDYTEYYPSDLFRSLTLIGQLDQKYEDQTAIIHNLTKTYGVLPTLPIAERPNAQDLRKDVSISLERALQCRESSYAEASRLCSLTESLYKRVQTIRMKLEAQPKPPSREPTPLPQTNRARRGETDRQSRVKATDDGQIRHLHRSSGAFSRRRIIVPGEILPPRDPNSPSPSAASDSDLERVPTPMIRVPAPVRVEKEHVRREKTPRPPHAEKIRTLKPPKVRPPGMMGTNAHSSVAGISVSNAIAQLMPPPENPQPGSKHAPWRELTEWELNTIRKRMKKNADWMPSDIMVRRELKVKGRGLESYERSKQLADGRGEEVLDERPEVFIRPVQFRNSTSEPRLAVQDDQSLINRGMKLNEAKKLKKQQILSEKQSQAALGLGAAPIPSANTSTTSVSWPIADSEGLDQPQKGAKKRKRDTGLAAVNGDLETLDTTPTTRGQRIKKIKLNPPGLATTEEDYAMMTDELAADIPPPTSTYLDRAPKVSGQHETNGSSKTGHTRAKRSLATPVGGATSKSDANVGYASTKTDPAGVTNPTRPRSQGSTSMRIKIPKTKAASAEPEIDKPRGSHRRTSDSGPAESTFKLSFARSLAQSTETAASRRGRRPAPGILVTHPGDPGPKVSISKRKAATNKRASDKQRHLSVVQDAERVFSEYCICHEERDEEMMIACENPACPIEWYHVGCVGLEDLAKTMRLGRTRWFCPDCRDQAGADKNGILERK